MKLQYRNQRNAEITANYWKKPLSQFECWKVENKTDDEEEILLYDIIGWPFNDASSIVNYLRSIKSKNVKVKINTPGGDVFDGVALYTAMLEHEGTITTQIDSLAASIGSIIVLGGKKRQAHKNAMMMIHDPWSCMCGNQYDFSEMSELLGKISNNLIDIYQDNSSIGKRDLKQMMKDETWFTAKEMKDHRLINDILDKDGSKAKFDLSIFNNIPENLTDNQDKKPTTREIEKALRDVGLSQIEAKAFIAGRLKVEDIDKTVIQTELEKTINILRR